MRFEVIWLLKTSLWLIFFPSLLRAYRKKKLHDVSAQRIWLLFFLWNVALTLWGEPSEMVVDRMVNGLPIALYIKSACMLLTFYLYYFMLKPIKEASAYWYLDRLVPLILILGVAWFLYYTTYKPIAYSTMRFLVVAVRDATMLVYVLVIFIPFTLFMWKNEQLSALKLKQSAAIICFTCYVFVAMSSIGAGAVTLSGGTNAEAIASVTDPAVYIGSIAFMVTVMPYRWLSLFFHLERIRIYRRLYPVATFTLKVANAARPPAANLSQLLKPDELELMIYRTLISILDHYHAAQSVPSSVHLYEQIQSVIHQNQEYADLVKGMSRVKV